MMHQMHQAPPRAGATAILTRLFQARTGQQLSTDRQWRIETTLKPLLRDLGFATIDDLAVAAERSPAVGGHVVDALLNQESSFFRDAGVLELVAGAIADMQVAEPGRRLRLWSAGCSSGQEPLSLAMLFAERETGLFAERETGLFAERETGLFAERETGKPPLLLPEIVATDVSDAALARARAARYSQFEIQRGLPVLRMIRWFEQHGGDWVARPELVRRIVFRNVNLVADPLPLGRFDVVLCRNVLLYLAPAVRAQVLDRLATVLRPGGLLVLGAGETVIGQTDAFRPSPRYRGLYEPA